VVTSASHWGVHVITNASHWEAHVVTRPDRVVTGEYMW